MSQGRAELPEKARSCRRPWGNQAGVVERGGKEEETGKGKEERRRGRGGRGGGREHDDAGCAHRSQQLWRWRRRPTGAAARGGAPRVASRQSLTDISRISHLGW
jgi:hypothetical protein